MRPADAAYFAQRYASFEQRLRQADQKWLTEMKPYAGRKIVTYHRPGRTSRSISISMWSATWSRGGHSAEPAAHAPAHRANETRRREDHAVEPYFDLKTPKAVARETGGLVVVLMPSVAAKKRSPIISSCSTTILPS